MTPFSDANESGVHDYVLERIISNDNYRWVIFCRKCGHVSFYGNATNEQINVMQADLPRLCSPKPKEPSE